MVNKMFPYAAISNSQIKKMLIFDAISISIIILPGIAASGAQRDGLLAIIIGSLAAIAYSLFILCVIGKTNGELMEFSAKSLGKAMSFIFALFYIVKIVFSAWFSLKLFAKVINEAFLPDTNIKIIIFLLVLVSIYMAVMGVEVKARLTELLFFIVIIPLILLFIFGFKRVDPTNLFPLYTTSNKNILYTSYYVLITYSVIEGLLFITPPLIKPPERLESGQRVVRRKSVFYAVFSIAAINLILFILVLGLLGLTGAREQFKASILIMQLIQIPGGFVQRQDAIMLTIWTFSTFSILSAYFIYLAKIANSFIKLEKLKFNIILHIILGALMFLLCCVKIPLETLFSYYGMYMAYIGFPQSICIPLIIVIFSKVKNGKNRKGEAYEKKIS